MKRQGVKSRIATACFIALSALLSASPALAGRLVFVSVNCAETSLSSIQDLASLPGVDGLALEIPWSRIELAPGKYAWSFLDTAIRTAAVQKKYVTLYFTGSPKLPGWLLEGGKTQTFVCGNISHGINMDAVPWDKTYLEAYTRFLNAAAVHIKSMNETPYVFAVGVVAPQRDCTIDGSVNGKLGTTAYNRAAYLLACKQMIDTCARTFPTARKFLPTPHHRLICKPVEDPDFYTEIVNYSLAKYGKSCWVFARDLGAAGSHDTAAYTFFSGSTGLAYQLPGLNAQQTDSESVNRAVNIGIANGAMYFEIPPASALKRDSGMLQALDRIHRN